MTDARTDGNDAGHDEHDEDAQDAADAEEVADRELPLDPSGPTELGDAVDG